MSYAEIKTSRQTAAELEHLLDIQFEFIGTETPKNKPAQKAYYSGVLAAAEYLFSVTRDRLGRHHIKPYPTESTEQEE